jgi:hypothetical protein
LIPSICFSLFPNYYLNTFFIELSIESKLLFMLIVLQMGVYFNKTLISKTAIQFFNLGSTEFLFVEKFK